MHRSESRKRHFARAIGAGVSALGLLAACSSGGGSASGSKKVETKCPLLRQGAELPATFPASGRFVEIRPGTDTGLIQCAVTVKGSTWTVSATKAQMTADQKARAAASFAAHQHLGKVASVDGKPAALLDAKTAHTLYFADGETFGSVTVANPTDPSVAPRRADLVTAAEAIVAALAASGPASTTTAG